MKKEGKWSYFEVRSILSLLDNSKKSSYKISIVYDDLKQHRHYKKACENLVEEGILIKTQI